ncbi:hypothetical protein GMORB2_3927 [Geosmithia morbida]|uniref:Uncharacterized protein n=1 Tax=Geosmithia morbida TaxID=1094350 RepID=A0A9P5D2I0_9HYPO|nr:uncharacterized protein GMORB2_3927 [Geosmithia morbida]KAF4125088.1 hypothetical protein GMORB2_3927 [Geosmithia morbida]
MASSPAGDVTPKSNGRTGIDRTVEVPDSETRQSVRATSKTPDGPEDQSTILEDDVLSSPSVPSPYDWESFERRYEEALLQADDNEREILREVEDLVTYFKTWASAASSHDDERAVKRLQTRRRFVNLSEERMAQKQQHCASSPTNLTFTIDMSAHRDKHGETNTTCKAPQQQVLTMLQDDLSAFFEAHFSDAAITQFGETFVHPRNGGNTVEESQVYEETWEGEEDELGYYDDGVKRTLTDEQIEYLRHSELRSLRRQQEKEAAMTRYSTTPVSEDNTNSPMNPAVAGSATLPSTFQGSKKRKKRVGNWANPRAEPKPDLRKRTWDVVDKGLDTLDYD